MIQWVGIICLGCNGLPVTPSLIIPPTSSPTATASATPTIIWFPPTATFTPFPTSTLIPPTPEMRPGIGTVLLQDDFSDSSAWDLRSLGQGRIGLGKNELTIAIQEEKIYLFSLREKPILRNFYAEITVNLNLCQEKDEYGMLVRVASEADYYRFSISCDGQARLDRILGGKASSPQPWIDSGAVPIGAPSFSRLGVWAYGAEMRFFANDQHLFTVRDPTISEGCLGVFARSRGGHALTVNFSDLIVYELKP